MKQADYVIVGAGPAAVEAAETLRVSDPDSSVAIISRENISPYSRMALPYFLTGMISQHGTYLRKDSDHYKQNNITLYHATVERIDPDKKHLDLASGGRICYGKLLIATGASPVKPPLPGLDLPGVQHCWTLDDAKAIAERAGAGANIVLMGAGFIGCIILEALMSRGASLTVIEAEDRMVPRMMNDTGGNMLKSWCENKGMTILTSTRVTSLKEVEGKLEVMLDNGASDLADLVVVATGVKANIDFARSAGIEINEGIKIDHFMRSNIPDIYAAGDCAEGRDFSTGFWSVHAIQPTATEHGHIAALNMTGRTAEYKGSLNMNVLDTAGLISSSFGQWQGVDGGDTSQVLDAERYRYTHLAFDDDRLVGALTIGRTDNIGIMRGLIQSRTRLGVWKDRLMKNPNRIAESYIANTFM